MGHMGCTAGCLHCIPRLSLLVERKGRRAREVSIFWSVLARLAALFSRLPSLRPSHKLVGRAKGEAGKGAIDAFALGLARIAALYSRLPSLHTSHELVGRVNGEAGKGGFFGCQDCSLAQQIAFAAPLA